MSFIVFVIGVLMLAIATASLIAPGRLKRFFYRLAQRDRFYFAAGFRIIVGLLLLLAAEDTRVPTAVSFVGLFSILAGGLVPILGHTRVLRFAGRWIEKPVIIRLWGLAASALGAWLVWAGS